MPSSSQTQTATLLDDRPGTISDRRCVTSVPQTEHPLLWAPEQRRWLAGSPMARTLEARLEQITEVGGSWGWDDSRSPLTGYMDLVASGDAHFAHTHS